ncbi:PLP-dependent aminotransferase family protein [Oceanobacillus chungangensis]|uniref:GntR family transcriptional regulator n=1 Tax=Oceanobacillus chungangensis TaxID=1229152 RepID=A0A3D8PIB8_9BACI|nr:PLP-dependent aminotransferase family protein [Oceanobacillus chungangensis]RDW15392.1 GntR family transcriptional regulator [Oceanobacillus chungangensis]
MIYFHIDKQGNAKYIYKQIYENLKKIILEHRIPKGEKLPSKRELAADLGVSINSVTNAYEQLLAEGYIYTIERKGYYIEDITDFDQQTNRTTKFPSELRESYTDEADWISLSHITTDISMFPFHEWLKSQQQAIQYHQKELAQISHPQGPFTVRKTISNMIAFTRGVICEPEQIVIGSGTQPLINQLMDLQPKNSKVAVENPGYSRLYRQLISKGLDVIPISLDYHGIDMEELEHADPDFLFITPSHQFPTGKIMPISRRIELLNWSTAEEDRYIVEDDYDSEFKYDTDNIPSLQSLDRSQRVIYTGTFSKTLLPSFRISYMVLPPNLLKLYREHYLDWIHGSNSLQLFALHYFIKNGEYKKHIRRMNKHYEEKRKKLVTKLQDRFKNKINIQDIPAGLHFLAHFHSAKSYHDIRRAAKQEKLELYTIQRFLLKEVDDISEDIQIVIGFANIKDDEIDEAVERLYRIIHL